jgi:hypothetical protein
MDQVLEFALCEPRPVKRSRPRGEPGPQKSRAKTTAIPGESPSVQPPA